MARSGALGSLNVLLGLDSTEFTRGMGKAEYQSKKALDNIGRDAKKSAAAIATLSLAIGAVAFTAFINNTMASEKAQAQLGAVLKSTGEAAGYSRKQLNDMAAAMSMTSTVSDTEINEAQTTLLAFTGIVGNEFTKSLQAAIDMSARTGMSVVSAAETIGRALDIPSKGLTSLSKQGFRFTDDQKKLAERLEATGRTAEAQGIILGALEESYGGAAKAARDTFGGAITGLKNQLGSLMTGGDGSLDGAKDSVNDLTDTLASEETKQAFASFVSFVAGATNSLVSFAAASKNGWPGMIASLEGTATISKDAAAEMQQLRREIEEMEIAAASAGSVNQWVFDKGIQYRKGRIEALKAQMNSDLGGMFPTDVPMLGNNIITPSGGGGGGGKKPKKTKNEDPLGVFMKDINIEHAMSEYQKYLDFIDEATGRTKAKIATQQNEWLSTALSNGDISYSEIISGLDTTALKFGESTDAMSEFAIQAQRNIESALGDGLYKILKGDFDNIGTAFADMMLRMSTEAAAANLAEAMFGKEGSGGGWISTIIGAAAGAMGGSAGVQASGGRMGTLGTTTAGGNWTSGFKLMSDGGFTGHGGKYDPAGIVHKGEYVLNQGATKRVGVGVLDRINKGYANGGLVGGGSAGGGTRENITIINQTTGRIDEAIEQRISPTERAIIIREAVKATAQSMYNPNSDVSKGLSRNTNMQRAR